MQVLLLVVQVNHLQFATATTVEIPVKPDLLDYFRLNELAFTNLGYQIDKLREVRMHRCPTGDEHDVSTLVGEADLSNSLTHLIGKVTLAVDQLGQSITEMQKVPMANRLKTIMLQLKFGFKDILAAETARDTLIQYRDRVAGEPEIFGEFSNWVMIFPGTKYPPGSPKKNLLELSWRIEGAGKHDFDSDTGKLTVDTAARATITERFASMLNQAVSGIEATQEAKEWADANLKYSIAKTLGEMERWFECWKVPLKVIVYTLENKLGPFPQWERED
ncbi:hypothetical protein H072_2956 [Dactylellina haptotyla CBS 200.50]|uniref:Uncharacterized protein n=1 Tax=Dactylellina haptotyla (strain CBS 200.50) TaxID=1284197 RepID=S8C5Z1_DACHA|nr:hypothetical protein H072_2956 [Dactylellina haptotyla CBS 200.50]